MKAPYLDAVAFLLAATLIAFTAWIWVLALASEGDFVTFYVNNRHEGNVELAGFVLIGLFCFWRAVAAIVRTFKS